MENYLVEIIIIIQPLELLISMAFHLSAHVQTFFIQVNILLVQISFMKGEHHFANQHSTDPH